MGKVTLKEANRIFHLWSEILKNLLNVEAWNLVPVWLIGKSPFPENYLFLGIILNFLCSNMCPKMTHFYDVTRYILTFLCSKLNSTKLIYCMDISSIPACYCILGTYFEINYTNAPHLFFLLFASQYRERMWCNASNF